MKAVAIAGLLACLTAACAALPTAGPTVRDVERQASEADRRRFAIIDIDDTVVAALRGAPAESLAARFPQSAAPPPARIGVGDTLAVTIWEAAGGGLFSVAPAEGVTPGSRSVALPEQTIGRDGMITVPFAGRIAAVGRTPFEVQRAIEQRLKEKAIEPQAIVTITKNPSRSVTVSGETVAGARIPLSPGGDRLLDVIAAAGGAKSPLYETFVRLSRGGVTATIAMERLVSNPTENIYAQPGDVVTLVRLPQTFAVFGAAGTNALIPFAADHMTLAEALAKAGGLQDQRSDPAGVFLFRYEPPERIKALGRPLPATGPDGLTPVIYRLDLRDARSFFLARRFPIDDKDILYIANAELTELQKFFTLLNTLTGPVLTGVVIKNAAP
jgi:polysaccharide export outer membrane protein